MFKIADLNFTIVQSYLDAYVDEEENEMVWGLQIKGQSHNEEFDDWSPHVNSEVLVRTKPGEMKTWLDLAGKKIEWDEYSDDEEEPHALLYIFEHEPIYQSKVLFELRNNEMFVKWNALCDVGWDEKYSDELPLQIETKVLFNGILFGKRPEESCRKMIAPFLNPEDFQYIRNKNGVSLLVPVNYGSLETNCLVQGDY